MEDKRILKQVAGSYLQFRQNSSQGFIGGKCFLKVTFMRLTAETLGVDVAIYSDEPLFDEATGQQANQIETSRLGFDFSIASLAAFDTKKSVAYNLVTAAYAQLQELLVTYNPGAEFQMTTIKTQ